MAERRTTRGRPRGTTRPTGPRASSRTRPAASVSPRTTATRTTPRPRLTGRAGILVLVLAVLTVSFASSLRAYMQQRQHLDDLRDRIVATGQDIEALEREKRRWKDDAYVQMQARQRFGYLMPGETGFQVIDENGYPLDSPDTLDNAATLPGSEPTAWWDTAWESVEAAGDPPDPRTDPQPADQLQAPDE